MGFILSIISIILVVFWFFMLLEMVTNDRIKKADKAFWLLGFIFLSLLTAFFYYFTKYDRRKAWWR